MKTWSAVQQLIAAVRCRESALMWMWGNFQKKKKKYSQRNNQKLCGVGKNVSEKMLKI